MKEKSHEVHEPEEELASAEQVIEDVARLKRAFGRAPGAERSVSVRIPLWALLEAIDSLDSAELRQVGRRVERRLSAQR